MYFKINKKANKFNKRRVNSTKKTAYKEKNIHIRHIILNILTISHAGNLQIVEKSF